MSSRQWFVWEMLGTPAPAYEASAYSGLYPKLGHLVKNFSKLRYIYDGGSKFTELHVEFAGPDAVLMGEGLPQDMDFPALLIRCAGLSRTRRIDEPDQSQGF